MRRAVAVLGAAAMTAGITFAVYIVRQPVALAAQAGALARTV